MNNEITKEMMKNLNDIREKLGITAFDDIMSEFLKVSEKFNRVYTSRQSWRARAEKAESELKELKKDGKKIKKNI